VNGEDQSVVDSLSFTLSPAYNGAAGVYSIIPYASAENYTFTPVNGQLYVNPWGSGLKNIRTTLTCVEVVDPATNGGYGYIANFKYTNDNASPVYIPIGADNIVSGSGSFNASQQPQAFLPGGGTFSVPFDGVKITWTVKSFNGNGHKSSSASSASSTSSKCRKSAEADEQPVLNGSAEVVAYPNPVSDKLNINLEQIDGELKSVEIYDLYGKKFSATVISQGDETLEVNMTGMSSGIYFIRLNLGTYTKTLRIVKL
jgi:hypothetical protein